MREMSPASPWWRRAPLWLASLVLAAAVLSSAAFWWALGREHAVPGGLAAGDRLQCASYTPFRAGDTPLRFTVDRQRLAEDFALLSPRVGCLRLYSVRGMELVPEVAREYGLTLILGAWIGRDPADNEREVAGLIRLASQHRDVVQAVLVGNEVLLRREQTAAQLAAYLRRVKAAVPQPVSYGDVWEFWLRNRSLAADVDFVTIHLLPYWEDEPAGIDAAIAAVAAARAQVVAAFPGKDVLVGEAGWPSEGRQRETAVPSRLNQARFVRGFLARARSEGWRYNLIEAFDQPWKRAQEGAVGGYWGLFDADRRDKGVLAGPVSNVPGWRSLAGLAVLLAGLVLLASGTWRSPLAAAIALVGGNGIALHGHQWLLFSRSPGESLWFAALGAVAVAATWIGCRRAAGAAGRPWHDVILGVAAALAAIVMLGLVFDPRYRHFPVAVFLVPALAALWPAPASGRWRERQRVLAGLLVLGVPVVLWQETLLNGQAVAWCAVAGLLAFGLLRATPQGDVRAAGLNTPASASASSASTVAGAPKRTL
jgi:exo-beta-1,3-glucanase (GH17 family)